MLQKYKMEEIEMDSLKRKLFCELEMYEDKVCACQNGCISDHDVHCIYLLCKTLYYLDCITDGDKQEHHVHYMHDGSKPDYEMDHVHHHADGMKKKEVMV